MRVLLATEGESDEIVGEHLIWRSSSSAAITKKNFATRGFYVVRRSISLCVKAAHFGHYDVLVIHFDLNNTLSPGFKSVKDSKRWQDADERLQETMKSLPSADRERQLVTIFMTPCQSTEAWTDWGLHGGDGQLNERKDRKLLKRELYGNPPLGICDKTREYVPKLAAQMDSNDEYPISLREFMSNLESAKTTLAT